MKVMISDFDYKGKRYVRYELDMPHLNNVEEIPWEQFMAVMSENLDHDSEKD